MQAEKRCARTRTYIFAYKDAYKPHTYDANAC